jgi:hypothetical protein
VLSPNHCCHGKAISVTYSESVFVALSIEHAKRMPHLLPVRLHHILPHSHKRHGFRTSDIENKMCVLIFLDLLSEIFLILRGSERDVINVDGSSCEVRVILVGF